MNKLLAAPVLVLLVGAAVAFYLAQVAPEPEIRVVAFVSYSPVLNPVSQRVVDLGRVSGSGSFNYTAILKGAYYMTFDNTFSFNSTKEVSFSYTAGGETQDYRISVPPEDTSIFFVGLNADEQVKVTYSVLNGDKLDFYIVGGTCTETVPFSMTLTNTGSASGFATVAFLSDGQAIWTNRYFVGRSQQLPVSDSVSLPACTIHVFSAEVLAQQKS